MASVWLAEDRKGRRAVRSKSSRRSWSTTRRRWSGSQREAQTLARIRSPFVPQVFGHGSLKDEFLSWFWSSSKGSISTLTCARNIACLEDGCPCRDASRRSSRRNPPPCRMLPDVKPENIFLSGSGDELVAKLFDFGIAKVPESNRLPHAGRLRRPTPSWGRRIT